MTSRPVIWPLAGMQTAGQLQRKHRRLDHNRKSAAAVMTKLARGACLHLSFERGARRWLLSDGTPVSDLVARVVTADPRVINVDAAVFKGMPGQTFRYVED